MIVCACLIFVLCCDIVGTLSGPVRLLSLLGFLNLLDMRSPHGLVAS